MEALTPSKQLAIAYSVAAKVFESTEDKQGEPYIHHCIAVKDYLCTKDKELQAIAILHDVVEDTPTESFPSKITMPMMFGWGFSERVVTAVWCLTHNSTETYEDYIKRVALNEDAKLVKLADLQHNLEVTRIKGNLNAAHFARVERYHKAFVYLNC